MDRQPSTHLHFVGEFRYAVLLLKPSLCNIWYSLSSRNWMSQTCALFLLWTLFFRLILWIDGRILILFCNFIPAFYLYCKINVFHLFDWSRKWRTFEVFFWTRNFFRWRSNGLIENICSIPWRGRLWCTELFSTPDERKNGITDPYACHILTSCLLLSSSDVCRRFTAKQIQL